MESKQWAPSRWKPAKLSRYLLHVKKSCVESVVQILGKHEGGIIAAQVNAVYREQKSVAMLRALGVKLIGDE